MILNEEIPEDLRVKIQEDAEENNVTLNAVAVWRLAYAFNVDPPAARGRYRPSQSARFKLRVPEKLHRKMRVTAARHGMTIRGLALSVLAEHYNTEPISSTRRPRKEAA